MRFSTRQGVGAKQLDSEESTHLVKLHRHRRGNEIAAWMDLEYVSLPPDGRFAQRSVAEIMKRCLDGALTHIH
jgi:hypothetical protein